MGAANLLSKVVSCLGGRRLRKPNHCELFFRGTAASTLVNASFDSRLASTTASSAGTELLMLRPWQVGFIALAPRRQRRYLLGAFG